MPTDPAQAVLRDFENIMWLALLLGLAFFGAWRFFFSSARSALPVAATEEGSETAIAEPSGKEEFPGLDVRHFTGADLLILPLVLIKYSVTLQLAAAALPRLPQILDAKLGLVEAATETAQTTPAAAVELGPEAILFETLVNVILISLVIVMIQWVGQRNVSDVFGLGRLRFSKWLLWSALGAVIATPVILALSMHIPDLMEPIFGKDIEEQAAVMNIRESKNVMFTVLLVANAIFFAPIVEEFVFRGYFYGVLKRHTSAMFSAFITAALFSVAHQNILALLPLWGLALFFTLFYEATRCLWVPIGMHAVFNAVNILLILIGVGDS